MAAACCAAAAAPRGVSGTVIEASCAAASVRLLLQPASAGSDVSTAVRMTGKRPAGTADAADADAAYAADDAPSRAHSCSADTVDVLDDFEAPPRALPTAVPVAGASPAPRAAAFEGAEAAEGRADRAKARMLAALDGVAPRGGAAPAPAPPRGSV